MATYAIGDIQGCFATLISLLEKIHFNPESDQLLFAGDLVNRGPQSLEALRYIKSLGSSAKTVLGNHDLHLLCVAFGYQSQHPKDTLSEILESPDKIELLEWLRHQPLLIQQDNYTLTHAGIPPIWSTHDASIYAREAEHAIQSEHIVDTYFANMYGNEPNKWDNQLTGPDRWRTITNYLTRMRFCQHDSTLDFKYKSDPTTPPAGFLPWFQHTNHKLYENEKLLFGHWAALEGKTNTPHAIALDTGCVWGGKLTAYCLEAQKHYYI